jgi:hypothetical protein
VSGDGENNNRKTHTRKRTNNEAKQKQNKPTKFKTKTQRERKKHKGRKQATTVMKVMTEKRAGWRVTSGKHGLTRFDPAGGSKRTISTSFPATLIKSHKTSSRGQITDVQTGQL